MDTPDRILELIRTGAKPRQPAGRIVVHGDGNVLGNVYNVRPATGPRHTTPRQRRTLRISAINYIRSACRAAGHPSLYQQFAQSEFGTADLDELSLHELERVRGWRTALSSR